jgi:hypothetical protein
LASASSRRVWPGLLLGPGGDDHQVGRPADLDVVGADHRRLGDELEPVVEVQHLGPGLVGVDVVQGDGPADPPDQAGVGQRGPTLPAPTTATLVVPAADPVMVGTLPDNVRAMA